MCINIGVDLDGVVADFTIRKSQKCREIYGEHLPLIDTYDKVEAWDWAQWYPLSREQLDRVWDHIHRDDTFWESLPILNEVGWRSLRSLQDYEDLNVYFITARPQGKGRSVAKQSINWLAKNGWKNPQVIVTNDKASFANSLDLKFFVDDNSFNCHSVKDAVPHCEVFVVDTPYNKDVMRKDITRLYRPHLPKFVGSVMQHFATVDSILEIV